MAEAENERFEMQSRIEQLETDKRSLEAENARTIQENRALLDQLEALNNSVTDSETQIRSLEATLLSSEQTIRKLETAEARAAAMGEQITDLEAEQAQLQNTIVTTEAEARSAMHRWRKAERGISDLQEKLEKMEREAREERERHAEVMGRMERQRAMEKDLNTAAGRLKGAAAAKTMGDGKDGGGTVVSHFVRDLLQDNASLQLGMAELRELLINSNDEIQQLREQLMFHQPMDDGLASPVSTLRTELEPDEEEPTSPKSPRSPSRPQPATSVSQELHIHHHYHVAKPTEPKKPKKKRPNLNSNVFAPPRPFEPSSPPSPGAPPMQWRLQQAPNSQKPSFMSHSVKDSLSTAAPSARWSVFSEQPSDFAPSSAPSSPTSNRHPSVFDRGGYETSYPTSPITSADPGSPAWTRQHRKQPSNASSTRKFSTPRPLFLGGLPEDNAGYSGLPGGYRPPRPRDDGPTVLHTAENVPNLMTTAPTPQESRAAFIGSNETSPTMQHTASFDDSFNSSQPRIHRVVSRESIMSLTGGLDIHTLKGRPSQLTLRPLGAATADTGLSAVIARPTIARGNTEGKRGSVVLRDNLLSIPDLLEGGRFSEGQQRATSSGGLGKLVGWRPWSSTNSKQHLDNGSSTPTSDRSRSISPHPTSTASPGSSIVEISRSPSSDSSKAKPLKEAAFSPRSFGINQPGAIPGFQQFLAFHQRRGPPSKVVPEVVDTEALRDGLAE